MAIKAGQILHVGSNGFVIDRIQSAGASSINVNTERIEELGNYNAIATLRDTPDLSFEMETYDMGTEIHELLLGAGSADAAGTKYDVELDVVPFNIISPFKASGAFNNVKGLIIPYLNIESLAYSFSVDNVGSLTVGLRGDSIYYVPGGVYEETFDGDGIKTAFTYGTDGTGGVVGPCLKSSVGGSDWFVLDVMYDDGTNGWVRQKRGASLDFTDTSTIVTFNTAPASGTDNIRVVYGHATEPTYAAGVHKTVGDNTPAAVKGRYVEIQFGGSQTVWTGIQSASVEWRATLERDEELGNPLVVDQDFDVPDVTGTFTMKAATADALFDQILAVQGVTDPDIVNASDDPPEIDIRFVIKDPFDGATLQTLRVPDAQFDPVAIQGQVGNKLEVDFAFTSAGGDLDIYKGDV